MQPKEKRRRRRHTAAFKAAAVAACRKPGASVAAIALELQLNANMLRAWIKESGAAPAVPLHGAGRCDAGVLAAEDRDAGRVGVDRRPRWIARSGCTSAKAGRGSRSSGRRRQPVLARRGCASCSGDPDRSGLARRRADGHACRDRDGARAGRERVRVCQGASRVPLREPPCEPDEGTGARWLRSLALRAATAPRPVRLGDDARAA